MGLIETVLVFALPFFVVWLFFRESIAASWDMFYDAVLFKKKSTPEKAEYVLKRDFSSKYAKCTFYALHDYSRSYTQSEWMDYYKERTRDNTLDKNTREYMEAIAPLVNAVVVGGDKYLMRRGMENLANKFEKFLPGLNDRISPDYFVEPYEYVKDEELAAKSWEEERLRKKKQEEDAPKWAAHERCRNCIHQHSCSTTVKLQTGACGGYTPRR